MSTLDQVVSSLKQNPSLIEPLARLFDILDESIFAIQDAEHPEPMASFEVDVIAATRRFAAQCHASLLLAYDIPHVRTIEVQGALYTRMKPTPSTYHCLDASFSIERSRYRAKAGGEGICPLEMRAGIVEQKYTPEAAKFVLMTASSDDYRAVEKIHRTAQLLGVSKSALERDVVALGARIQELSPKITGVRKEVIEVVEGARSLSIQFDRTGIPFEEVVKRGPGRPKRGAPKTPCQVIKRQCYCACLTLHDEEGEALMTQRFSGLPDEGEKVVGETREVFEAMMKQHPGLDVVLLCDGASEMMEKARQVAGKHDVAQEIVDYYHASQYVHQAVRAAGHPESWGKLYCERLLANKRGAADMGVRLRTWGMGNKHKDLQAAIAYFENHSSQMDYAEARAKGYPVGSGNVEATCKSVIAVRFKRSGARWKKEGAAPLMSARTWLASDQGVWDAVFPAIGQSYVIPIAA